MESRLVDDVFLARVGHDLRGELATMVAGVHYLLRYETQLTPQAKQMLERVNGAGSRLSRLLDEVDDAAFVATPPPISRAACRLEDLIRTATERLASAIAARSVVVSVSVPPSFPELSADPGLLGRALEYLLDFAVARSEGATVTISADLGTGVPVLTFSDEGGPVDAGALPRLFHPFEEKELVPRGAGATRRRERLGLGLAIARGVLDAHGFRLSAEALPDGRGIRLVAELGPRS